MRRLTKMHPPPAGGAPCCPRSVALIRREIDFPISIAEENQAGGDRHADGKKRLRDPCDDVDFVHDVSTPLREFIER